jgi:hypothetical protein
MTEPSHDDLQQLLRELQGVTARLEQLIGPSDSDDLPEEHQAGVRHALATTTKRIHGADISPTHRGLLESATQKVSDELDRPRPRRHVIGSELSHIVDLATTVPDLADVADAIGPLLPFLGA